ncbi:hypothetical protein [Pseudodesulfovibrio portus]|uniref:Uncharacterized protein n=1 Tax=Pseudodesulfovibrio portus TaxID=231439 RepID=A0ABM8ART7_9BACT|nr:hypothetical protein [Pseudodesulfovibrio portus]BDQ34171.1 hypothetical protein JCM14722_17130 [Pseudodesulfovibrio portus]
MKAKETVEFLKKSLPAVFIIHYSCQNLNDANEGYSPRVTSIAVLHIDSDTMHSFSIHLIAEIEGIARDNISDHYDVLEAKMLGKFFAFVGAHQDAYWLHWNMTNINYGFEAIEHRYRVLTKEEPPHIEDSRRYNLSALIQAIYGNKCVDDPKMLKLMELNGGKKRDFLTGHEEVQAFVNKEYVKLHKSTMTKAYWFKSMFFRLAKGKVKTKRSNWRVKITRATEHWSAKLIGFVAALYAVYQILTSAFGLFATGG